MSHLDPDDLTLMALGESVPRSDQSAHLAACETCREEVADLSTVVHAARRAPESELATPSPAVWQRIADEIRIPAPHHAPRDSGRSRHLAVRPRLARRLIGWGGVAIGALATTVLIVTLSLPRPVDIATAVLDPFPDHPGAAGTAALEREPDGSERVVVDLDAELRDDGYREVWLLTEDGSALVSLGVLDGRAGSFVVPADVDTERFSVVDISQEAHDGDSSHSGDSIVRGALERS